MATMATCLQNDHYSESRPEHAEALLRRARSTRRTWACGTAGAEPAGEAEVVPGAATVVLHLLLQAQQARFVFHRHHQ